MNTSTANQTTARSWVQRMFASGPSAEEQRVLREHERENADMKARIVAIDRVQAVIEFALDGTILHANDNFLRTLGYSLDEIKGKHHSMFAEPGFSGSSEYRAFWDKLNRGEYDAGQY